MTIISQQSLESYRIRLAIIVFVVIATVLGSFATIQSERATAHVTRFTNCLAEYNNESQAEQAARAALNQDQIDATNTVIIAVAKAKTATDVDTALQSFLAEQAMIATKKAQHPVPPPPSEVCK